jgi:hypothetical protein
MSEHQILRRYVYLQTISADDDLEHQRRDYNPHIACLGTM